MEDQRSHRASVGLLSALILLGCSRPAAAPRIDGRAGDAGLGGTGGREADGSVDDDALATTGGRTGAGDSRADAALDTADAHSTTDGAAESAVDAGFGSTVVPPTGPLTCGTVWKNPITAGVHDPTMAKDGDAFFVFGTAGADLTAPRTIPFQTSTDRLHWTSLGAVLSAVPAWANSLGLAGAPEVWAPDVHFVNGKYFLYYSISSWGDVTHSGIGLMTNSTLDPAAPGYRWNDIGKIVGSPEGGVGVNVIDPDLFVDDDGSWWLVYGSYRAGLRLVPLDPTTGLWNRATAPITLTTSLGEGADIIKNDGFYYLFASRGTCCAALNSTYEIVYGRATKVTGPYLGKNGQPVNGAAVNLLPAGSDGNPGQGGQAFYKENGQYYMIYHAYQPPVGAAVLNIRPIYFDAGDWVTLDPCLAKGYQP